MYFNVPYLAVENQTVAPPNDELSTYVSDTYPTPETRVNGDVITITAGRLADGRIEYTFQSSNLNGGIPVQRISSFYNDQSVPATWAWNAISLRYRKSGSGIPAGTTIVFNNLEYGDNYTAQVPEPASLALLGASGLFLLRRRRSV